MISWWEPKWWRRDWDFPNVTLVGVLSADQALYSDDFRSYERAFALLTRW